MENLKTSPISYAVFGFTLAIVLINLTSLFFPSLLLSLLDESDFIVDPFEMGPFIIPILTVNIFLLGLGALYFAKKLPDTIRKSIDFVFNFEVSHNVAIFVVVIIIFFYIGLIITESRLEEGVQFGDYDRVLRIVEAWPDSSGASAAIEVLHVKNFLLKSSLVVFQNIKVIPTIASISLVLLTYFFTREITHKRFAGIVAMIILIQSHLFLRFDTSATYSNFWTLFYLLSLYLIYKKWYLSPISYLASIFSKPLTVAFLPITLFFVYRAEIPKRKKIKIVISYAILVGVGILGILLLDIDLGGGTTTGKLSFSYADFVSAFTIWAYQLRLENLFWLFILPVTVGLFLKSRQGITQADSILILLSGAFLAMPLLAGLTDFNLHPYRLVPFLVFFAIAVGTLFSKKITQQE